MKILLLPGDGIGPEIMNEAKKILKSLQEIKNIPLELDEALFGGAAIDATGQAYPAETKTKVANANAILLAAIGGPKWDALPQNQKPEKGLLELRKDLEAFANLRPVKTFPALAHSSTLKPEVIQDVDLLVVRELIGGIYFGNPRGELIGAKESTYVNTASYALSEIERILVVACEQAMKRKKILCSVDKANVLEVSQFWRTIASKLVKERYPEIQLFHMYVDNAAMQLIRNPRQFDVIVTSNLFGDILSDEASMLTGSIGLLPSASLGDGSRPFLYEPIHGSAPDLAGQNKANPLAMILSVAMMLRHSFKLKDEAASLELAVDRVLEAGYRTADLGLASVEMTLSTSQMGSRVDEEFRKILGA